MESEVALNWADYLIAGIILALIVIEFIADQQQYRYQEVKHTKLKAGEPLGDYYKRGFTHTGLWAYMRHPNYMAEQAIWIVFYFFSVIATGSWMNWSISGALLLLVLFRGSSDFSESISLEKYPEYKKYVKEVGRFLPLKGKFKP
jgi:steroid 5-alpha reductase family enzyme